MARKWKNYNSQTFTAYNNLGKLFGNFILN